jgi:hypothetical protein
MGIGGKEDLALFKLVTSISFCLSFNTFLQGPTRGKSKAHHTKAANLPCSTTLCNSFGPEADFWILLDPFGLPEGSFPRATGYFNVITFKYYECLAGHSVLFQREATANRFEF